MQAAAGKLARPALKAVKANRQDCLPVLITAVGVEVDTESNNTMRIGRFGCRVSSAITLVEHQLRNYGSPAVGFHLGAANVSAKFVNMRLKAMLIRSVVPSLEGTWCLSQDGNITMRPA